MIDRREALRKLTVVGAAGIGFGAVRSVPVFAYDAPVVTVPFTVDVQGNRSPMQVVV